MQVMENDLTPEAIIKLSQINQDCRFSKEMFKRPNKSFI